MSEKKTLRSHLTLAEVTRFASAKLLHNGSCPRCGVQQWEYADESSTREIVGFGIISQQGSASGIYATILFKCQNCGFTASHAKDVVVQWLNDNE